MASYLSDIIANAECGATLDWNLNEVSYSTGYQVSVIDGYSLKNKSDIESKLIALHKQYPMYYVGFWYNDSTNLWDVDVSAHIESRSEAEEEAFKVFPKLRHSQDAIYSYADGDCFWRNDETGRYNLTEDEFIARKNLLKPVNKRKMKQD